MLAQTEGTEYRLVGMRLVAHCYFLSISLLSPQSDQRLAEEAVASSLSPAGASRRHEAAELPSGLTGTYIV